MYNTAVLTGDLVNSRNIDKDVYDEVLYTLNRTLNYLSHHDEVKYDIYRGDSFQIVFPNIKNSIKGAILIRLSLKALGIKPKSLDARISIGIGSVDTLRENLGSSTGNAFTLSGHGLEEIKNQHFSITSTSQEFNQQIALVTKLIDVQLVELSPKQANALYEYLTSKDKLHSTIAKNLNTTRVNTTQLLKKAHYQLFNEYIELFASLSKEYLL